MGNGPIQAQLPVDCGGGHTRIVGFEITDLFLDIMVQLTAFAGIRPCGRNQGIKAVLFIIQVPAFNGRRSEMVVSSVRPGKPLGRDFFIISLHGRITVIQAGDQRGDRAVAHQSNRLLLFLFHQIRPPACFFTV